MHRRLVLNLAAHSRWKQCLRILNSYDPPPISASSRSFPSFLPICANSRMQYASRGGGRRAPPPKAGNGGGRYGRDGDDFDDEDDESDDDLANVEDPPGYEWDYETWNLLHQGRKEGQLSRKWPLPMYKAREMVDFHILKNRLDGLKVITDPKKEYELRRQLHEGTVDLFKRMQDAMRELDALQERKKLEEISKNKETLQITESETKTEDSQELVSKETLQIAESETKTEDSQELVSGEVASNVEVVTDASNQVVEGETNKSQLAVEAETVKDDEASTSNTNVEAPELEKSAVQEMGSKDMAPSTSELSEEALQREIAEDLSGVVTAVDDVIKDVLSVPEVTTLELGKDILAEAAIEQATEDDGVNVFDYDKWVAYREQQVAERYAEEEERKHATLRWKIQLVLGPGDVVHPANRKASVSVYVRELCLSKYGKQRLLALVGRRYNAPKDELTIVSERYPHRYENQKDVLRTLLALIEEAKKADQLVYDARIRYLKAKKQELINAEISVLTNEEISVAAM